MPFIAQIPPVVIGMEACGGAHDWARRFREHGHSVKVMAPQFVKPSGKSHKHDAVARIVDRAREHFLARAAFARQQYGNPRSRGLNAPPVFVRRGRFSPRGVETSRITEP